MLGSNCPFSPNFTYFTVQTATSVLPFTYAENWMRNNKHVMI